jgi:hypothetical protein
VRPPKLSDGSPSIEHMFEEADSSPPGQEWQPQVLDLLATDDLGRADWDTTLSAVLATGPGPQSAAALHLVDVSALNPDQRMLLVQAWEAQVSHAVALQHEALAALAGLESGEDDLLTQVDAACALSVAGVTAQRRIDVARALVTRLPVTRERLASGRLGYPHVCAIVDELLTADDEVARAAEAQLFAKLRVGVVYTPGQLRRRLRRIVLSLDSEAAQGRQEAAAQEVGVSLSPEADGMAAIIGQFEAADAMVVWEGLTATARKLRDPEQRRSLDYWRAQALVGWATAALADPDLPVTQGKARRNVAVVIDLPTLLALADNPAELPGYGPIPASVARALATDAHWQRWVRDPVQGHLLDLGRVSYRPNQALRDYVLARDGHCTFPGCTLPAWRCDIDHEVGWADGGVRASQNLQALCRRHHSAKTSGRWTMKRAADGVAQWARAGGRPYRVPRSELPGPP